MEDFISNWSQKVEAVPSSHVLPLDVRPQDSVPISKDIPVIDLGEANKGKKERALVAQQLLKAWQEYGFFQVINHGVAEDLMDEAMKVYQEFFSSSAEEKANYAKVAANSDRAAMFYSNLADYYGEGEFQYWRDALQHNANVGKDDKKYWPDNPPRLKEVIGSYSGEVRKLSKIILALVGEALGLEAGHFKEEITQRMVINHYPPCPDPSLTLGLGGHCDSTVLTLTQQALYGLQILKQGKWLGVEPIPHAFVVNAGMAMTVFSNGILESCVHRVVTTTTQTRTSISTFILPNEGVVEPLKSLVGPSNPPVFKSINWFAEFMPHYLTKKKDNHSALEAFKITA